MKSKRLTFRKFVPGDAPRIAELAGDWNVASMTARIPYPYTPELAQQWLTNLDKREYVRAVLLNGEVIGACGYFPGDDGTAEIGYWIGKPWWGHGYATEAATAIVRHCFARGRFRRLTCCHFCDNERSARVIEKLGFTPLESCSCYCEARRRDVPVIRYERKKPPFVLLRRRAA